MPPQDHFEPQKSIGQSEGDDGICDQIAISIMSNVEFMYQHFILPPSFNIESCVGEIVLAQVCQSSL